MVNQKKLEGKRILVTGGSRGLGRTFCHQFAKEGAQVAFNYGKDVKGAKKTLHLIDKAGQKGKSFQVSVLDTAGLSKMVSEIEKDWGRL